jgi:hypothetical protein
VRNVSSPHVPKLTQFRNDLYTLLSSEKRVTWAKSWNDKPKRLPFGSLDVYDDRYAPIVDETGAPIEDAGSNYKLTGSCTFAVIVRASISERDTQGEGLLLDRAAEIVEWVEDALKYSSFDGMEAFQNAKCTVYYTLAFPNFSTYSVLDGETEAIVRTTGTITYTQHDR